MSDFDDFDIGFISPYCLNAEYKRWEVYYDEHDWDAPMDKWIYENGTAHPPLKTCGGCGV